MYDYLDNDGVQAVLEAIKNKSDTAIAGTQDLANSMLKDVVNVVVNPTTSTGNSVNETKYQNATGIAFNRGNGEYVSGQKFTDTYYKYGNANAKKDGLLSAEDFAFIDKYKKIRNSYATYTFTSAQSYITVSHCYGSCNNGLAVLSGWFTSTGTVGNPYIISGSFPSAHGSFVCGIIVNIDSPKINTRLLVAPGPDGSSLLQWGGDLTPGKYFFLGVYTTERCIYNLPYTL